MNWLCIINVASRVNAMDVLGLYVAVLIKCMTVYLDGMVPSDPLLRVNRCRVSRPFGPWLGLCTPRPCITFTPHPRISAHLSMGPGVAVVRRQGFRP